MYIKFSLCFYFFANIRSAENSCLTNISLRVASLLSSCGVVAVVSIKKSIFNEFSFSCRCFSSGLAVGTDKLFIFPILFGQWMMAGYDHQKTIRIWTLTLVERRNDLSAVSHRKQTKYRFLFPLNSAVHYDVQYFKKMLWNTIKSFTQCAKRTKWMNIIPKRQHRDEKKVNKAKGARFFFHFRFFFALSTLLVQWSLFRAVYVRI